MFIRTKQHENFGGKPLFLVSSHLRFKCRGGGVTLGGGDNSVCCAVLCVLKYSTVRGGIYALGKAHMRSTPSLRSFPNVAFVTVPMFA